MQRALPTWTCELHTCIHPNFFLPFCLPDIHHAQSFLTPKIYSSGLRYSHFVPSHISKRVAVQIFNTMKYFKGRSNDYIFNWHTSLHIQWIIQYFTILGTPKMLCSQIVLTQVTMFFLNVENTAATYWSKWTSYTVLHSRLKYPH